MMTSLLTFSIQDFSWFGLKPDQKQLYDHKTQLTLKKPWGEVKTYE